jgi:peptidoglycan/LPS O-acetylase OafA/YrhL
MTRTGPDQPSERLVQVDGLRFFAILLVMLHHYLPALDFPLFGHGVTLFFVLSGFFATRQLMRAKRRIEAGTTTRREAIGHFHVRRYLRIFPVYFLVVLGAIVADLPYAREAAWWHLTFTSNWWVLQHLEWMGPFSPFWSLAVLEQFYLFWPALLICLPRRAELPACVALVIAGVAWRGYCHAAELSGFWWLVFPAAGFDQLGMGALLAAAYETGRERWRESLNRAGLGLAGPAAFVLTFVIERAPTGDVHYIYQPALMAFFFVWLTDAVARGAPGAIGRVLAHAATRAGGRVSYGIFAFHEFTAYLIPPLLHPELPSMLENGWRPWILVPATCMVAAAVFVLIELPVLRLKRHFRA